MHLLKGNAPPSMPSGAYLKLLELIQYVLHVTIPVVRQPAVPPVHGEVIWNIMILYIYYLPLPTALNDGGTVMIEVNS